MVPRDSLPQGALLPSSILVTPRIHKEALTDMHSHQRVPGWSGLRVAVYRHGYVGVNRKFVAHFILHIPIPIVIRLTENFLCSLFDCLHT